MESIPDGLIPNLGKECGVEKNTSVLVLLLKRDGELNLFKD